MRKIFRTFFLTIILFLSINILPYVLEENVRASETSIDYKPNIEYFYKGDINNLIDSIGVEETGDSKLYPHCWDTINYLQMYGRYQFSKITLIDIGVDTTKASLKYFLKHHKFQKECMKNLLRRNLEILDWCVDYKPYLETRINGVNITLSGVLGASHLGGVGAVRDYLYTNGKKNATDGHRSIADYLKKFANYYVQI